MSLQEKAVYASITPQNIREKFEWAMATDDATSLGAICFYLINHGWAGGISIEEAISAVEDA